MRLQRSFEERVHDASLIVIGRVSGDGENQVVVEPEAYLKGAASGGTVRLANGIYRSNCDWAGFPGSGRVLAILDEANGALVWPEPSAVFELRDAKAYSSGSDPTTEAQLVSRIRSITGQYAVPAASSGEGAGINWTGTILPVGAALTVILVISLFLMRIWHRIDPS